MRLPVDEGPLRPLHAGCRQQDHRHAKGCLPQSLEYIADTAAPNKTMTNLYALGWTEHSVGSQNIRCMAIIQLLLGNMAWRGRHQCPCAATPTSRGITDFASTPRTCRATWGAPGMPTRTSGDSLEKRTPKALRPGQMNFPQNFPQVVRQPAEGLVGDAATKETDFCLRLPAQAGRCVGHPVDLQRHVRGQDQRLLLSGDSTRLASVLPNKRKVGDAAKLKYLVIMIPAGDTGILEAPRRVQRGRSGQDPDRLRPSRCLQETARHLHQLRPRHPWRWKAGRGSRDSKDDTEIPRPFSPEAGDTCAAKDGGAFPGSHPSS